MIHTRSAYSTVTALRHWMSPWIAVLRWFCLILSASPSLAQSPEPPRPPLDYVIVVTGGEILDGLYPDSHTHFLTRTLRPLSGRCVGTVTVDDREEDLTGALRFALGKAPLVLVTGGLGPTPNDITRETIAAFTAIPLREREEVVTAMERRFNQSRDQLRANLRRQALVPEPGGYLPNTAGTAVGLLFHTTNATIVALPGPPRELQPMVEKELVPFLQTHFGLRPPGLTLTLRFVGLGQSQISQTLQEQVELRPDLVITSQFDTGGRVDFTFALPGRTASEKEWLDALAATLRRQLGDHLYAEDDTSLEEQVIRAFARHGITLALVEIGSGGHVTDSLARVENHERVLVGSYVAPAERGLRQLLQLESSNGSDVERLNEIGRVARARSRSNVVVVIGFPELDPGQPRSVRVLWVDADCRETRFPWTDSTAASHALLTTRILDWLRQQTRVSR